MTDVVHHRIDGFGRFAQPEHVERTGDLDEQARRGFEVGVIPRRLDEGDDGFLDLDDVDQRLLHQHVEQAHDFGTRHFAGRRGSLGLGLGAETPDMVVERSFDDEQRAGDVEQIALVGLDFAVDNAVDRVALLAHPLARLPHAEHAEGIGNAAERLRLRRQVSRIAPRRVQVNVQRFLDPQ